MRLLFLNWVLILATSLSGLCGIARADGFSVMGSVSTSSTADSRIQLQGTAPPEDRDIFITVIKQETSERIPNSFYGAGPDFSRSVYLPRGAGTYQILVFGESPGQFIPSALAQFTVKNTDPRDLSYLAPSGQVESDADAIVRLAKSITAGLSSDYDRSRAIHDWIGSHIRYDLSDDNPPMDALGTLNSRDAECSGYATLTAALNRAIGLKAKIVEGIADSEGIAAAENDPPHVWNEVLIDGRWVTEDSTFDAGSVNRRGLFIQQLSEDFFDPAPAFFAQTHRKQQEEPY